MSVVDNIQTLVSVLPEKYQPIFSHPELSDGSSRGCQDRLVLISSCVEQLVSVVGRPLRILDLGCAQGYFSLNLASLGHTVHGVDFLDLNVNLCKALAMESPGLDVTFECDTVENAVSRLVRDQYDLVLGLSVFHHLVHAHGAASVTSLVSAVADKVAAGIYELALRDEPLYWAESLPADPAALLSGYAFTRLLARQPTHLSTVFRPVFFVSNKFWYVGDVAGGFSSWSGESHPYAYGTHQQSRRYYFGEDVFVKKMTLGLGGRAEINRQEYTNEVRFLSDPPAGYPAPRLIATLDDESDLYVVRERAIGTLLSDLIDNGSPYDAEQVVVDLLDQLVALECAGLYHNDVRCWNVLMSDKGAATLIDYGAVSPLPKDCSWLEDLLFSFLITAKEIFSGRILPSNPGREPSLDFTSLPPRFCSAFARLFVAGPEFWSFSFLREQLTSGVSIDCASLEWLPIYRRLQGILADYNSRLGRVYEAAEQRRADLAEVERSEDALKQALSHANALIAELRAGAEASAVSYRNLEEDRRGLVEWAKELELNAASAGADNELMAVRLVELEEELAAVMLRESERLEEAHSATQALTSEIARLDGLVQHAGGELEFARETAEVLRAELAEVVSRTERERSSLLESNKVLERELERLEGLISLSQKERSNLGKQLESLSADLARVSKERDGLLKRSSMAETHVEQLQASFKGLEVTLSKEQAQCHALRRRVAGLEQELAERLSLIDHKKRKINGLEDKSLRLARRVERLETSRMHDRRRLRDFQMDLSQRNQIAERSRYRIRQLELTVSALEQRIESLHASRSWRITAPLRWFSVKVLGRPAAHSQRVNRAQELVIEGAASADLPKSSEVILTKRLAALDQIASRVRKLKR